VVLAFQSRPVNPTPLAAFDSFHSGMQPPWPMTPDLGSLPYGRQVRTSYNQFPNRGLGASFGVGIGGGNNFYRNEVGEEMKNEQHKSLRGLGGQRFNSSKSNAESTSAIASLISTSPPKPQTYRRPSNLRPNGQSPHTPPPKNPENSVSNPTSPSAKERQNELLMKVLGEAIAKLRTEDEDLGREVLMGRQEFKKRLEEMVKSSDDYLYQIYRSKFSNSPSGSNKTAVASDSSIGNVKNNNGSLRGKKVPPQFLKRLSSEGHHLNAGFQKGIPPHLNHQHQQIPKQNSHSSSSASPPPQHTKEDLLLKESDIVSFFKSVSKNHSDWVKLEVVYKAFELSFNLDERNRGRWVELIKSMTEVEGDEVRLKEGWIG
jgi:hypothetical protein